MYIIKLLLLEQVLVNILMMFKLGITHMLSSIAICNLKSHFFRFLYYQDRGYLLNKFLNFEEKTHYYQIVTQIIWKDFEKLVLRFSVIHVYM